MKLIYRTSADTHATLTSAIDDLEAEKITQAEYNEIILACFKVEEKRKMEAV